MSKSRKRSRKQTSSPDSEPPAKKQKNEETFVKWKIFSDDNQWVLKIFKGTPLHDVKQNISDITGIQQFICMDADNDRIALSSYLPHNTKIYIQPQQSSDIHQNIEPNNENTRKQKESETYSQSDEDNDNDIDNASLQSDDDGINNVAKEVNDNNNETAKTDPDITASVRWPRTCRGNVGLYGDVFFKTKGTTRVKKVMDAYCAKIQRECGSIRFIYRGALVSPDQIMNDFTDGDVEKEVIIYAAFEQHGS